MSDHAPFPLDGGRAGDGGVRAAAAGRAREASPCLVLKPFASTPTHPSPIEGEGFERERTSARVVKRAREMRAEPTWTEKKLWERLRALPVRFGRQAPVGPYVADFLCHRAALVVEVDGDVHDRTDVALRDLKRDAWFESQGYFTLRVSTRAVEADMDAVVTRIRNLASNRLGKAV
ncbi:DUF559 domain-containing protein [Brevundimonas naejangsanensis]|uniref:DUF559 domain-containing protein n=1 Tax=Brevundimonas naejangsanensis TaxID=588932 RepID=A0A494RFZ2_9CAUL|nr:endonuclease domain-containing protein [Brevundimonas naejangsanensis]AYG95288.1 DUF559 domain-containing protein [Brevundimonas naejangsanensis]